MPPTETANDDLGYATREVVVLAFRLVGDELSDLGPQLETALQKPEVKDAITSALNSFVAKRMASGGELEHMSQKDAMDLLIGLGTGAGPKIGDALAQEIKKTPHFKSLERAIKDFEAAAKSSPMGVWIDHHQGLLIIAGLALVVGGSVALFVTKTGALNVPFRQLSGKPVNIVTVGKLTLQGQLLDFQPDKSILGAGVLATGTWDRVKVTLQFGAVAAGTQVQKVSGGIAVKTSDVNVSLTGTTIPAEKTVNLGLTLGFDKGRMNNLKIGVGAIVTDDKLTGGSVNATYNTRVGQFGFTGQTDSSKREVKGLATWTLTF